MNLFPGEVFEMWNHNDTTPEGWEIDVEDDDEGGQPNGVGTIEPSDNREWYSDERESHHRKRMVITITGPWEEGPTDVAARIADSTRRYKERERLRREAQILQEADAIRAREAGTK